MQRNNSRRKNRPRYPRKQGRISQLLHTPSTSTSYRGPITENIPTTKNTYTRWVHSNVTALNAATAGSVFNQAISCAPSSGNFPDYATIYLGFQEARILAGTIRLYRTGVNTANPSFVVISTDRSNSLGGTLPMTAAMGENPKYFTVPLNQNRLITYSAKYVNDDFGDSGWTPQPSSFASPPWVFNISGTASASQVPYDYVFSILVQFRGNFS